MGIRRTSIMWNLSGPKKNMSYSNGRCQGQEGKKSTMYVSLYWMIPGFKASVIFFAKLLTRSNLDVKAREGIGFIQQVEKSLNVVQRANEMRQQRGRIAIKSRNRRRGEIVHAFGEPCYKVAPFFPETFLAIEKGFSLQLLLSSLYFQGCFFTLPSAPVCQRCLLCSYTNTLSSQE